MVGASRKMPFWLTRFGRPGAVVLLLEDEPLEDADVAPAVLGRPAHHGPAVLEHGVLPGAVRLEALGRIERGEGVGGDVRGQPRPGLGPEGLLLGLKVRSMTQGIFHSAPAGAKDAGDGDQVSGGRRGRPAWCSTSVRTKKSTTAVAPPPPPVGPRPRCRTRAPRRRRSSARAGRRPARGPRPARRDCSG